MTVDVWIQLEKLKEDLYPGTLDILKRIEALENKITSLEKEMRTDIQKHVSAIERRVQILEKSVGKRE